MMEVPVDKADEAEGEFLFHAFFGVAFHVIAGCLVLNNCFAVGACSNARDSVSGVDAFSRAISKELI